MKISTKIGFWFALAFGLTGIVILMITRLLTSQAMVNSIGKEAHLAGSQTADSVDRIVYRRLERWQEFFDINETVIKAVQASNSYYDAFTNPQELINKQDARWTSLPTDQISPEVEKIIQSNLSTMLRTRTNFYAQKYGYNVFPEVFVTDKYGTVVASTGKTSDFYQADEDWWQKAFTDSIFVGDYQYDASSNTNSLEFCLKIVDAKGNFIGVGKVIYDIKDIFEVLEEVKKDQDLKSLKISLLTANGQTIYPVNAESAGNAENKLLESVASTGYKEFKGLGWLTVLEYDKGEILAPVNSVVQKITLVIVIATLICILLAFILSKLITRPLAKLKTSVEIVEKGNLDHQTGIKSKDEVGALSNAFDKMVLAVKEARKDVDKKVEDQTKEIVQKNNDLKDQQKAVLNILEDMAEAKTKLESYALDLQKFKLAVDYTTEHIVITDPDGLILYANPAVTKITGFETRDIMGKKAGSALLWGGQMPRDVYSAFWKTIKTNKKPFAGEFNNHRKNGEQYIAEANVAPVLNDKGEVIFIVGIERDITRAKEIDRMKTEFISLASHQLRTPLSAMKWFSEMLLTGDAGKLSTSQQEFVQNIYDSNERMVALVSSLLNISRIESGRLMVDPQPTDLKDLVESVLKELDVKIKEKGHTVVTSVQDNLAKVNVDPKLVREVYKNLLTNAIKYTPNNGEITVTVSKKDDEILSQVSDNGYGIPEKEQYKVFDKFYRGENIIKYESDGTGLGLYLVKAIIESSGGKIWFNSQQGKGTSFWFSFPAIGMKAKKGEVSVVD